MKPKSNPNPPGSHARCRTPCALTIAGSDSGGGAGVQGDLATFAAHDVFGTTAITAITAQNTVGVQASAAVDDLMVLAQIDSVLADLPVAAVKIGMLGSASVVAAVATRLAACAPRLPLVIDPVMRSTSGRALLTPQGIEALVNQLLPLATVWTPNLPEAAALLAGYGDADSIAEALLAGRITGEALAGLQSMAPGAILLLKGGHGADPETVVDHVLTPEGAHLMLSAARVPTTATHGTGCALSAAIAANLAWGQEPIQAIRGAHRWLNGALRHARIWTEGLGSGHGPLALRWRQRS